MEEWSKASFGRDKRPTKQIDGRMEEWKNGKM